MAFKFDIQSDALTNYGVLLDYAKTNPYFDEAYLAQQVDLDRKQQYVYGIAALSQAKGFKQTDFDKHAYDILNQTDKDMAFDYLMYKSLGDRDEEYETNLKGAVDHYTKLYQKSQMTNAEKTLAGVGLSVEDTFLFALDVIDTVVDFPFMAYTLGHEAFVGEKYTKWAEDIVRSDWITSWGTGKTIAELQEDVRMRRFYETDQFATIQDAMDGASLFSGQPMNVGNFLDFFGGVAGSFAKMALNFIPVFGQAAYWGLTVSEIGKQAVTSIDDPWLRLAYVGGSFATEYLTEMIFTDSIIGSGLIKTDKWLPKNSLGFSRLISKIGIDATTNTIEEMSAEIASTVLNQMLYTTFGNRLSESDRDTINPDWNTLFSRTVTAGVSGAVVGIIGASFGAIRGMKGIGAVDAEGNVTKINGLQAWSYNDAIEAVRVFADPMYERNKVAMDILEKNPDASDADIKNSQAYQEATELDNQHQAQYVEIMSVVQKDLEKRGYKDAVVVTESIDKNFKSMSTWYNNFAMNSYAIKSFKKEEFSQMVSFLGKFQRVGNLYVSHSANFSSHFNGQFSFTPTISSHTDAGLDRVAKRSGYKAIVVGDMGSADGKTTGEPIVDIDNVLYVDKVYYDTHNGVLGLNLRTLITNRLVVEMIKEPEFIANNYHFYRDVINKLSTNYVRGSLPYTELVERIGQKEAHKKIVSEFLSSSGAMRALFIEEYPSLKQKQLGKILNKQTSKLIERYGSDKEAKMEVMHTMAVIVNRAIDASLQDFMSYDYSGALDLKAVLEKQPLERRLVLLQDAMDARKGDIRLNSKNLDLRFMRDMNFVTAAQVVAKTDKVLVDENGNIVPDYKLIDGYRLRAVVLAALNSNVLSPLVSDAFKDKNVNDLSNEDVARAILTSEALQNYLGINSPSFRDAFIAHLSSVIQDKDVDQETRTAYMASLDRFVMYTFALETNDVKRAIADYVTKVKSRQGAGQEALNLPAVVVRTEAKPSNFNFARTIQEGRQKEKISERNLNDWVVPTFSFGTEFSASMGLVFPSFWINKTGAANTSGDIYRRLVARVYEQFKYSENEDAFKEALFNLLSINEDSSLGIMNEKSKQFIDTLSSNLPFENKEMPYDTFVNKFSSDLGSVLGFYIDLLSFKKPWVVTTSIHRMEPFFAKNAEKVFDVVVENYDDLQKNPLYTRKFSDTALQAMSPDELAELSADLADETYETSLSNVINLFDFVKALPAFLPKNKIYTWLSDTKIIIYKNKDTNITFSGAYYYSKNIIVMPFSFISALAKAKKTLERAKRNLSLGLMRQADYDDVFNMTARNIRSNFKQTLVHEINHAIFESLPKSSLYTTLGRSFIDSKIMELYLDDYIDYKYRNKYTRYSNKHSDKEAANAFLALFDEMSRFWSLDVFAQALGKNDKADASVIEAMKMKFLHTLSYFSNINEQFAFSSLSEETMRDIFGAEGSLYYLLSKAYVAFYKDTASVPLTDEEKQALMYNKTNEEGFNPYSIAERKTMDKFYTQEETTEQVLDIVSPIIALKDKTVYEPAAGSGSIVKTLKDNGVEDVRASDLYPDGEDIEKKDMFDVKTTKEEYDNSVVFTNPPFGGSNGDTSLISRLINHSLNNIAPIYIGIHPNSMDTYVKQKDLDDDIKLIKTQKLGVQEFKLGNSTYKVNTVAQVYVKKDDENYAEYADLRTYDKPKTKHPDYDTVLLSHSSNPSSVEAFAKKGFDFFVIKRASAKNEGTGIDFNKRYRSLEDRPKTKDGKGYIKYDYFIVRAKDAQSREIIEAIDFNDLARRGSTSAIGFTDADFYEEYERIKREKSRNPRSNFMFSYIDPVASSAIDVDVYVLVSDPSAKVTLAEIDMVAKKLSDMGLMESNAGKIVSSLADQLNGAKTEAEAMGVLSDLSALTKDKSFKVYIQTIAGVSLDPKVEPVKKEKTKRVVKAAVSNKTEATVTKSTTAEPKKTEVKTTEKPKLVKVEGSETTFKANTFLDAESAKKAVIKQVETKDRNNDNYIKRVESQGATYTNGTHTAAKLFVYRYFEDKKETNSYEGFKFKKGVEVSNELQVTLGILRNGFKQLNYNLVNRFNVDNKLRSPILLQLDKSVIDAYRTRYEFLVKRFADLKVKTEKELDHNDASFFDEVKIELGDIQKDYFALTGEISAVVSAIKLKATEQTMKERRDKSLESSKNYADNVAEKVRIGDYTKKQETRILDAVSALRKAISEKAEKNEINKLRGKVEIAVKESNKELKQARKDAIEQEELSKDQDLVDKVIARANANKAMPEYALLAKILNKEITDADVQNEIKASGYALAKSFNKFLRTGYGYTQENKALQFVLGKNYENYVKIVFKEALIRYKSRVNRANLAEDFRLEYNRVEKELTSILKKPLNEIVADERKTSAILNLFERLSEHPANTGDKPAMRVEIYEEWISELVDMIFKHYQSYDILGNLNQGVVELYDKLNEAAVIPEGIELPDEQIDLEDRPFFKEMNKEKQGLPDPEKEPTNLSQTDKKAYDAFVEGLVAKEGKALSKEAVQLLKDIFYFVHETKDSVIQDATTGGLVSNYKYDSIPFDVFKERFMEQLELLTDAEWLVLASYIYKKLASLKYPTRLDQVATIIGLTFKEMSNNGKFLKFGQDNKTIKRTLRYFSTITAVTIHAAAATLPLGKVAKRLNQDSLASNALEQLRWAAVQQLEETGLSRDEAIAYTYRGFMFSLNLQNFGIKQGIFGKKDAAKYKDLDLAAFKQIIIEELSEMEDFQLNPEATNPSPDMKAINEVLDGVKTLNHDQMSIIYKALKDAGQYRALLFLQDLYMKEAMKIMDDIHIKDIIGKDPKKAKLARRKFLQKISSFRFLAMLSNPSVFAKNFVQNRLNSFADNKLINPLTNKVFKYINDRWGNRIKVEGQKSFALQFKGQDGYADISLRNGVAKINVTSKPKIEGIVYYTQEQVDTIREQLIAKGMDIDVVTPNTQYNLSRSKEISQTTKDMVEKVFVANGFLDFIQSKDRIENINKNMLDKYIARSNPFRSEALIKAHDIVYQLLEGDDYAVVRNNMIYYLENLIESEQLYTLDENSEEFEKQMKLIVTLAFTASLEVVYKADNKLFRFLHRAYEQNALAGFLGTVIVPFPRVSSNVFIQLTKYSPLGLANFLVKVLGLKRGTMEIDADKAQDQALLYNLSKDGVKGAVGTALYTLGFLLAALGLLRIDDEKDYRGVVMYFGDWRIDLSTLSVLAQPLLLGAALKKTNDDAPEVMESFLQELLVLTFLGNVFDVFQSYKLTDSFAGFVESYALSYIPAIFKSFYKWFDPYEKDYSKAKNWFEKVTMRALPIFAPNKIDPFTGSDQKRYASPFFDFLNSFSPISIYQYDVSPEKKIAKELGVPVSNRNTSGTSFDGVLAELTPEQITEYNRYKGQSFRWLVGEMAQSAAWQTADKDTKIKLLEQMKTYSTEFAKVKMWLAKNPTNTYQYANKTVMYNLMSRYLQDNRLQLVGKLPESGVNYYGEW